jgi:hypothetical protein
MLSILFTRIAAIAETAPQADEKPPSRPIDLILSFLSNQINFKSGLQRFCFALLIVSLCSEAQSTPNEALLHTLRHDLGPQIVKCLDDEHTIYFDEIALVFTRLQKETRTMFMLYHERLMKALLGLNYEQTYLTKSVFTFEDITSLGQQLTERFQVFETTSTAANLTKEMQRHVRDFKVYLANLMDLNKQAFVEQEQLQTRSLFALASASIDLGSRCERMNPLVRPLIDCIRFESNADLQAMAGKHLALLLSVCAKRLPNPVPKIFKNLLSYLCTNDPLRVPSILSQPNISSLPDKHFYECNRFYGILSDTLGCSTESGSTNGTDTPSKVKRSGSMQPQSATGPQTPNSVGVMSAAAVAWNSSVSSAKQVEKRGAELAIKAIVEEYNELARLKEIVPDVVEQPLANLSHCLALFQWKSAQTQVRNVNNELNEIELLNMEQNVTKYQGN